MPGSFMRPVSHADMTNKNNPWEPFLGPPRYKIDTSAYDRQRFVNYDLPEAYKGENLFLRDNLDLLVLSGETFYTDVLLPMKRTDQLRVKWSVWEFNQHFTDVVPEEGVSRLIESERRELGASFLRRGLALQMEHGFMNTARGRENYRMNLRQIAAAVNETNNYGVIVALLEAPNYNREYEEKHGAHTSKVIDELMEREKFNWAIVQKMKNGFEKMDGTIRQLMSRYQGQADTWLVPPEVKLYLTKVRPEKTDYYVAGPKGPARVEDRVDSYVLFANNKVFTARQYDVLPNGSADPLVRQRQIGEHFIMVDRYADTGVEYSSEYNSKERSIEFYDEDSDDWTRVGLKRALAESRLFDEGGRLRAPTPSHIVPGYDLDVRQDFLTQSSNPGGPRIPVAAFGHVRLEHTSARTIVNLARTLSRRVSTRYAKGLHKVNSVIEGGQELFKHLASKPVVPAWFELVFAGSRTEVRRGADGRFWRSPEMHEWQVDPKTQTRPLPRLPDDSSGEIAQGALKGFGNWPGLKAMRDEYKNGGTFNRNGVVDESRTAKGYPKSTLKQASGYVKLIELMTREMLNVMPGSAFLDKRHTAPQFRVAAAENVVVETLFGMHGHALWYNPEASVSSHQTFSAVFDNTNAVADHMDAQDVDRLRRFTTAVRGDENLLRSLLTIFGMTGVPDSMARIAFDGFAKDKLTPDSPQKRNRLLQSVVAHSPFAFPPPHAANEEQVQLRRSMLSLMEHLKRVPSETDDETFLAGLRDFVSFVGTHSIPSTTDTILSLVGTYDTPGAIRSGHRFFTVDAALDWMRAKERRKMFDFPNPKSTQSFIASVRSEMRQAIEEDGRLVQSGEAPWTVWEKAMPAPSPLTASGVGGSYRLPEASEHVSHYFRSPLTLTIDGAKQLHDMRVTNAVPGAFSLTVSNVEDPDTYASEPQLRRMAEQAVRLSAGDQREGGQTVASMFFVGSAYAGRAAGDAWQTPIAHRIDLFGDSGDPTRRATAQKRPLGFTDDVRVTVGLGPSPGAGSDDRGVRRKRMRTEAGFGSVGVGSLWVEPQRRATAAAESEAMHRFREQQNLHQTMVGGRKASQDGTGDDATPAFNLNFRATFSALHDATNDPLLRALGKIYLGAPVDRRTLSNFVDNDVLLPMGFLVLRPHMRYNMMMGIKLKAGKDTGQTFHGHNDMQVSNNAHTKMHFAHYTYYSRSVVTEPKNVWIAHNIYARGTLGGGGIRPFVDNEYAPTTGNFGSGSVFFVAVPYEEREFNNPVDIGGRLSHYYSNALQDKESLQQLHYSTAARYNSMWGWRTVDSPGPESIEPLYYDGVVDHNTVTWRSLTYYYDRATGQHSAKQEGTGHWGGSKYIYPGCRAGRRGELVYMDAVSAGALR